MQVSKQEQKSHAAFNYAEHASTQLQLQSSHLIWFIPVDLFQRSEVMSG